MRRMMNIAALVLFIALSGITTASAEPQITWQPEQIDTTIDRGSVVLVDVTAVSDTDFTNIAVFVVPELAQFITITPTAIPIMYDGVPVSFELYIGVPSTTPIGVYEGTIHLQTGKKTISRPLPVVIRVGEEIGPAGGEITSRDGRATLTIPPGSVSEDPLLFTIETVDLQSDPPLFPPSWGELLGRAYGLGPSETVFENPPLILTLHYDPLYLPVGSSPESLSIAFEKPSGEWFGVDGSVVNTINQTVSAPVWHFTRFAIVNPADMTPPNPPTNVTVDILPDEPSRVAIDWTNPAEGFAYAKIYRSQENSMLGDVLATEIKPVCDSEDPNDIGCNEGPPYIDQMLQGENCYTVRSVDAAGNESLNNNRICKTFGFGTSLVQGNFIGQVTAVVSQGEISVPDNITVGDLVHVHFSYAIDQAFQSLLPNGATYTFNPAQPFNSLEITIQGLTWLSGNGFSVGIRNDALSGDEFGMTFGFENPELFPGLLNIFGANFIMTDTTLPYTLLNSVELPASVSDIDIQSANEDIGSLFSAANNQFTEWWGINYDIDRSSFTLVITPLP